MPDIGYPQAAIVNPDGSLTPPGGGSVAPPTDQSGLVLPEWWDTFTDPTFADYENPTGLGGQQGLADITDHLIPGGGISCIASTTASVASFITPYRDSKGFGRIIDCYQQSKIQLAGADTTNFPHVWGHYYRVANWHNVQFSNNVYIRMYYYHSSSGGFTMNIDVFANGFGLNILTVPVNSPGMLTGHPMYLRSYLTAGHAEISLWNNSDPLDQNPFGGANGQAAVAIGGTGAPELTGSGNPPTNNATNVPWRSMVNRGAGDIGLMVQFPRAGDQLLEHRVIPYTYRQTDFTLP